MKGRQERTAQFLAMFSDMIMVVCAWILAYYIRFYTGIATPLGVPSAQLYFKLLPFIAGIWWVCFFFTGSYRRAGNQRKLLHEGFDILQANLFATVCLIAFTYFYEEYHYSRLTLLVFTVLTPIAILLGRLGTRKLLRYYEYRIPSRRILLVTSEAMLQSALNALNLGSIGRSEIAQIVLIDGDIETIKSRHEKLNFSKIPEDWSRFLAETEIQSVIIQIPNSGYRFLDDHLERIADQIPDIRLVPDIQRYTKLVSGVDMLGQTPVLHLHDSPLTGVNLAIKRGFDILGSGIGLLLLSPILLVISILVRLSSPGPILYRQERMGLDGRRFYCLKFRSMPIDSEKETGAVWATADDQRATRFGSILRRTSLDELPQLINVFRGDMSLVGPRPERPVFVDEFRHKVPGYMLRHKVKTGITGWAQVNGWRGSTSIHKRIECDLYYIQNWSIWLDIKILFLTIEEVFIGKNAY